MALWFKIAIPLNVIYWGVFCYLLTRRRWNRVALVVSVFHMLFAGIVSVAPVRALLDPQYGAYVLGTINFEGRAAALPAAFILAWALLAAWVSIGLGAGRWMKLVAVGDTLFALSIGALILLQGESAWTFELGEHVSVTGIAGLMVLLSLFVLPFAASAIWAAKRSSSNSPPRGNGYEEKRVGSEEEKRNQGGFRYAEVSPFAVPDSVPYVG